MAYQEVIELYCKNCGGSLLPISEDFCKCQNCGATYTQLTAKKQQELLDSFLNKQKQEQLNALRSHLWQEVSAKYIDSSKILAICLDIKNIYPDDFLANFYEVVCGKNSALAVQFIDNIDCEENYSLIEQAVKFLIKSLKSEYLLSVNNLIERAYKKNDLQKYNSLTTAFAEQAKKVQDGVYELNVSRDVFVAYSSADMAYVQQIVSALEEQGLTCFVAMRNLQHGAGAVNNYQQALEKAMDNCKIFLFISSKNSRNFSCDAFKIEMPYIKKKDCANLPAKYVNTSYDKLPLYLKKPRVQWRIDDFKNPMVDRNINEFFSGLEYCYDVTSVLGRIADILLDGFAVCEEQSEADKIRAQMEEQNRLLQEQLKNQQEFLQKQAEEQEKRFKEQAEEQRRLKEQLNSKPTVNNVGGISIDDIIAQTERRKQEQESERLKQEERKKNELKKLEEEKKREEEFKRNYLIRDNVLIAYNGSENCVPIPKNVTKIGENAFKNKFFITDVYLHDAVVEIGENAFYGCSALSKVILSKNLKSISDCAFANCKALSKIALPNGIENVGCRAFLGTGLTEVNLPNSLKRLGGEALSNSSITKVNYEGSVSDWNKIDFYVANNFIANSNVNNLHIENMPVEKLHIKDENLINDRAFSGLNCLTEITLENVKQIGDSAFKNCVNLKKITITNGLKEIGHTAFYNCSSLTEITLPDGLTTIRSNAFNGCENLKEITIPASVKRIEYGAFKQTAIQKVNYLGSLSEWICVELLDEYSNPFFNLNDIYIDGEVLQHAHISGVYEIFPSTFQGCKSLKSVTMDNGLTKIGDNAFKDCINLTDINLPYGLAEIGERAFEGCIFLQSVQLPSSVHTIKGCAFAGCASLLEVDLPLNLKTISENTFLCCKQLKYLTLPESITKIERSAFNGCHSLTSLQLPSTLTSIGDWAFASCKSLTQLVIPNSVTSIGNAVLEDCNGLTDLTIPFIGNNASDSDKSLSAYFFNNKTPTALQSVSLTNARNISSTAFNGLSKVKTITLSKSVCTIGEGALYGCSSLENLTIPFVGDSYAKDASSNYQYSLGYIFGKNSFDGAVATKQTHAGAKRSVDVNPTYYLPKNLTSVTVTGSEANKKGSILRGAFSRCENLTDITILNGATSIEAQAFLGCKKLKNLTLPENITEIYNGAFSACESLEQITLSNGLTRLGDDVFEYCSSLKTITIPQNVTYLGSKSFSFCTSLEQIEILGNLTVIYDYTFHNCASLKEINLPDSITSINSYAFNNCDALSEITIPNGVQHIYSKAFSNCKNLTINILNAKNIKFDKDWALGVKKINGLGLFKKLFG